MRVVCFGDSLTTCGGENGRFSDILQDRFPDHEFINCGAGGETLADALARLDADVIPHRPDLVLLEFGANDWWRDERPHAAWARDLDTLVAALRRSGAEVIVLGVFGPYRDRAGNLVQKRHGTDARALAYRHAEAAIAANHECGYVPNIQETIIDRRCCWRDRNHPNEFGNRHVADTLEPLLAERLGCAPRPVRKPNLHTLRDFWDEAVALAPDRLAAAHGERSLTFAQANRLIEQLAAGLIKTAGRDRPKVAAFLPNCLEYFLLYWAVIRIGGVIVPLNTWLKRDSIEAIFANIAPDLLVIQGRNDRPALAAAAATPGLPVVAVDSGAAPTGVGAFGRLLVGAAAAPKPPLPEDAPAIIMHTSGTTALPKGAVMRHVDLMFNVMATINAHQFGDADVHLLVNPMFHCTALYSSLPTAAYQKTPVIITADTKPESLMALIEKARITTCLTVPSILQRIVALPHLHDYNYSALRLIGYAGSPMPVHTIGELQRHFPNVELHNFFGLTETISMTHVLTGEDALERPDSIGTLLPFVEAIVVDDALREVAPGTVGELLFARENVIPEYFNQPGKLDAAFVELAERQWFRTGDLAAVDEDGYFFIKGRKKDMIIVGGENVYAAEVENVLFAHPLVKEAAVIGVPASGVRESLGEMIKAFVVRAEPALSERDLRRHCHERLPSFKIPHLIVFRDALPRNATGKVIKTELH